MYARVDAKGRVKIPRQHREQLGLDTGPLVRFRPRDGALELLAEPEEPGPIARAAWAAHDAGDVVTLDEAAARLGIHHRKPSRRRVPWLRRRMRSR